MTPSQQHECLQYLTDFVNLGGDLSAMLKEFEVQQSQQLQLLVAACDAADISLIRQLILGGASLSRCSDPRSRFPTAFHRIAALGHIELFQWCLKLEKQVVSLTTDPEKLVIACLSVGDIEYAVACFTALRETTIDQEVLSPTSVCFCASQLQTDDAAVIFNWCLEQLPQTSIEDEAICQQLHACLEGAISAGNTETVKVLLSSKLNDRLLEAHFYDCISQCILAQQLPMLVFFLSELLRRHWFDAEHFTMALVTRPLDELPLDGIAELREKHLNMNKALEFFWAADLLYGQSFVAEIKKFGLLSSNRAEARRLLAAEGVPPNFAALTAFLRLKLDESACRRLLRDDRTRRIVETGLFETADELSETLYQIFKQPENTRSARL